MVPFERNHFLGERFLNPSSMEGLSTAFVREVFSGRSVNCGLSKGAGEPA